ncbi:hypothetical protein [Auritidibacter ignavus]|uniref:DUF732 domain-containing protein n=1 Tax=Auritidibacter ignavus TaxID=678932 RepID=A0AAJ6DBT4_9MICC|nr:hypothetical protein [Auritidibacter ignavus]WGH83123.1 hypothetical protein QDX20_07515 [Auritidibacter ignavus]WGH92759.1 hypothetical protein QDX21_10700 [Auritidibacter ignavus]
MRIIKMGASALAAAALTVGLVAPGANASEVEEQSVDLAAVESVSEVKTAYEITLDDAEAASKESPLSDEEAEEIADAEIPAAIVYAARHCLTGIGLNSTQITRMAELGSTTDILQAFGFAAVRCVMGR